MARWYCFLLLGAVLNARDWPLPDAWEDARAVIIKQIRLSDASLVIATKALQDRNVAAALRKRLKRQAPVILYTSDRRTASAWAIYRGIDVYLVPEDRLPAATTVETGRDSCTSNLPLVTKILRSSDGVMHCRPTHESTLQTLQSVAEPYLI